MANRGRPKGYKMSLESIEKWRKTRAERRAQLGPITYGRGIESDAPQEINDVWGSPGFRIMPKFDTSNKP